MIGGGRTFEESRSTVSQSQTNRVHRSAAVDMTTLSWPLRDCSTPRGGTAPTTTLGLEMASVRRHATLHVTNMSWSRREQWFVDHVDDNDAVLDLGAGAMHLRVALDQAGRRGVSYMPVDVLERGEPSMRVCHLNFHEYPLRVSSPRVPTVLVLQGVLEYVYDKLLLLRALRCAYPHARVLLSYSVSHRVGMFESHGWVAPLTLSNLREMWRTLGFTIGEHTPNCFPAPVQHCFTLHPVAMSSLPPGVCEHAASSEGMATQEPPLAEPIASHERRQAQALPDRPLPVAKKDSDEHDEEDDELRDAQATVAQRLRAARGGLATCTQTIPVFVARGDVDPPRIYNVGDEINIDVGAALLGVRARAEPSGGAPTSQVQVLVRHTPNASVRPKLLLIGSVATVAQPGDVLAGAGLKPGSERLLRRLQHLVRGERSVRMALVRGPKTCDGVGGVGVGGGSVGGGGGGGGVGGGGGSAVACAVSGDPAIMSHLLLPDWHPLRRAPTRWRTPQHSSTIVRPRAYQTRLLCVVPHYLEAHISRHVASLREQHEAAARALNCVHGSPTNARGCRRLVTIRLVSVQQRTPSLFARELLDCDLVVASALHGIILADSLRVPSLWLEAHGAPRPKVRSVAAAAGMDAGVVQPTAQPTFKYLDYFGGVGKAPQTVRRIEDAILLLRSAVRPMRPRFNVSELLGLTLRFVDRFPFDAVCRATGGGVAHTAECGGVRPCAPQKLAA